MGKRRVGDGTDLDDGGEGAAEELLVLVVHRQADKELRLALQQRLPKRVPLSYS